MGMAASSFLIGGPFVVGEGSVLARVLRDLMIQKMSASMKKAKRTLVYSQMSE